MRKILGLFLLMAMLTGCFLEENADRLYGVQGNVYDINKNPIEGAEIKFVDIKGKWDDFDKNSKLNSLSLSGEKGDYHISFPFTFKKLFGSETQYVSEFTFSVSKIGFKKEVITVTVKVNDNYNKKMDIILQKE